MVAKLVSIRNKRIFLSLFQSVIVARFSLLDPIGNERVFLINALFGNKRACLLVISALFGDNALFCLTDAGAARPKTPENGSSQGQNLALTGVFVPSSLAEEQQGGAGLRFLPPIHTVDNGPFIKSQTTATQLTLSLAANEPH